MEGVNLHFAETCKEMQNVLNRIATQVFALEASVEPEESRIITEKFINEAASMLKLICMKSDDANSISYFKTVLYGNSVARRSFRLFYLRSTF